MQKRTIEQIDLFYLSMPSVLDIGDGSQDALLIRIIAGEYTGWRSAALSMSASTCEASPRSVTGPSASRVGVPAPNATQAR